MICCMETAWLGKTVMFNFNMDICDSVLTVQIETFQRSLNMRYLEMGMLNVFRWSDYKLYMKLLLLLLL